MVQEKEIAAIRRVLNEEVEVLSEKYFQEGDHVRIAYGQFAGLEGIMAKRSNDARLVLKVEDLIKAFSISVPENFAERVNTLVDNGST